VSVDVEVLAREHKKALSTDDGIEFHSVPSLLSQLREAVFGGMESTGGSTPKSRLPISAGALDLYTEIDMQISEAWAQAFDRPPGKERPEALVSQWAAWADADTTVHIGGKSVFASDAVTGWVQQIEDFFDPPRMAEITEACVACGERWVYRKDDGQTVRKSALNFRRDRHTGETLDARCLNCGTVWGKSQFEFLANIYGKADPKLKDERPHHPKQVLSSACADGNHQCHSLNCRCDCHAEENVGTPSKD